MSAYVPFEPMTNARRIVAALVVVLAAVVSAAVALGGGSSSAAPAATPSFAKDVAPIVRETCAGCHRIGGIAPFAFRTERDLSSRALAILGAVGDRRMPPWPPSERSPAYVGEARRTLDAGERQTLIRWARAQLLRPGAARRGTPVGPPPASSLAPRAGETRRELAMPVSYTPRRVNGATDDYRCFLLDPKLARDELVTSAQIEPGAAALVHHVILYRIPGSVATQAAVLDQRETGPGWTCFGGPGVGGGTSGNPRGFLDDAGWIAAWAPGWGADRLRDGTGVPMPAGSRVVMQVHYNLLQGRRPDRSSAVLTTVPASANLTPVQTTLLPAPVELACRAGESGPLCDRTAAAFDQVKRFGSEAGIVPAGLLLLCGRNASQPVASPVTSCDRTVGTPITIQAIAGHMHLLGRSIKVELNPGRPGARLLLEIPRWSFHWQASYLLAQPIQAEPGDVLRVTCRHDASLRDGKPKYVLWGEGTTDEMCLGVVQVTPRP